MPSRFYRSDAFETAYDLESRLDRGEEREPTYAAPRQPIALHPDGTLKQRFAKSPAEQLQAIPVIRLHTDACRCESCRIFDAVDWSATFARETGAAK